MSDTPENTGLAAMIQGAVAVAEKMRADGASVAQRDAYLERVIRSTWPTKGVHHYDCDRCNDTGMVIRVCRRGDRCLGWSTRKDSPYGPWKPKYLRLCAQHPGSDYEHEYAEPCACARGDLWRPKPPSPEGADEEVLRPARKPTRFGR